MRGDATSAATGKNDGQASLVVRQDKGSNHREVFIPQELKTHLKAFLAWKRACGKMSRAVPPYSLGGGRSPAMAFDG
jgi:hypothetical protein